MKKFFYNAYLGLIFLFLYAPILLLIIFSFNGARSRAQWGGFSLKWYQELFNDSAIMSALYNTITIAIISAVVATIIGTAAAIGIHYMKSFGRKMIMNITYLPVLNADIVTGVSLMLLFVFFRFDRGWITILLAHITFNIPFVILAVLPKLKQLNPNIVEAANDLGASNTYAFWHIIIPNITQGIITGAILSFTLSIDDFVISFFTTGAGVSNLSILIYSMARTGVKPSVNALSAIMFVVVLALLVLINIRTSKDGRTERR